MKLLEQLYESSANGQPTATWLLRLAGVLWPDITGLLEYRLGNLSGALSAFARSPYHTATTGRYQARIEDMLASLEGETQPDGAAEERLKPFNGRVLFACHTSGAFDVNGYAVRSAHIANTLRAGGIQLWAVTRPGYPWDTHANIPPGSAATEFRGLSIEHCDDPNRGIYGRESDYIEAYSRLLERNAVQYNVSVIHAHSNYLNGLAAIRAARRLGIRVVYEMRGFWHMTRAFKEPVFRHSEHYQYQEKMELLAAVQANCVITLSDPMRTWLIDKGVDPYQIEVVPNCVSEVPESCINHSGGKDLHIGFLGSVTEYEGLANLLEAIAELRKSNVAIRLSIAGQGNYLNRLKSHCNKLGLTSSVVNFLGKLDSQQVSELYSQLDATACLRNRHELTELVPPLKVVESLGRGVPVLVTDLPVLRGLIGDTLCASHLCDDNSVPVIVERLRDLAERKEDSANFSSAALKHARENFLWDQHRIKYLRAYGNESI